MPTKVQRGGEVQPDTPNKGSDADQRRHEYGIPEDVSPNENDLDKLGRKHPDAEKKTER